MSLQFNNCSEYFELLYFAAAGGSPAFGGLTAENSREN